LSDRHTAPLCTDALVIGAGPVGLFQVFQLGLLEISCHVVDSLPEPGGQCIELYPDKPIYDIPAVPVCTGRELVERLLTQVAPMAPTFHLSQQVTAIAAQPDGRFEVSTSAGTRLVARTIVIAGGVGSFMPRQLVLVGIERHLRRQVFHSGETLAATAGRHVVVLGDDDAALDFALCVSGADGLATAAKDRPASVTLMHRRDAFRAEAATVERLRAACAAGHLRFIAGQAIALESSGDTLTGLTIAAADGSTQSLRADVLAVLWGLSPRLGPIADWGLQLERKQLVVNTETFETSVPCIFAVGDVNTYPGKKKLIVCGFHEATLAAYGAAARVRPERPVQLQYTTTSPRLHQLLGVAARKD
jgi:thioredoxin reductase (NADPH)